MNSGTQTWGSEGDVRLFLALAAGLRAARHDVTLAVTHVTNKDYTDLVASFGVPIRQVGRLGADLPKLAGEALASHSNILGQVDLILRDLLAPAAQDMLSEAKRLCQKNEFLIGHIPVHPMKTAAEQAGKPCISICCAPLIPSDAMDRLCDRACPPGEHSTTGTMPAYGIERYSISEASDKKSSR
jgi:sterol 3beta-glucosyltransferase